MRQIESKSTGNRHLQIGSEKPRIVAMWGQIQEPERLRAALQAGSTSTDNRQAVRNVMIGPLSAMSSFALMPDDERREAGRFWLDALQGYPADEVREAFLDFATQGDKYPRPQAIIAIIEEKRKYAWGRIRALEHEAKRAEEAREAERQEPTPESKAAVGDLVADFLKGRSMRA